MTYCLTAQLLPQHPRRVRHLNDSFSPGPHLVVPIYQTISHDYRIISSHLCDSRVLSRPSTKFKRKEIVLLTAISNINPSFAVNHVSSGLHASCSDPFVIQIAETLEDSLPLIPSSSSESPLQNLRDECSRKLLSTPWPSRKDEQFRFTDTSFIRNSDVHPVSHPSTPPDHKYDIHRVVSPPYLVIVDGNLDNQLSNFHGLPDIVFAGVLSNIHSEIVLKKVNECLTTFQGDLFWLLNGVGSPDIVLVLVPPGCRVENPLSLVYHSIQGDDVGSRMLISNPRVLVLVEEGGNICITEEYVSSERRKCHWANSVMEVVLREGAKLQHSYVHKQSGKAAHIKSTLVKQDSCSSYTLVELSTGGKLSRHNVQVQQTGPDTKTDLSTFQLSSSGQTQDLHSRISLDHPGGSVKQLHKCIVAHASGQAVFDGNIKVNRYAQKTEAGQLTRSLLLERNATAIVKPNLQITADDVRCSHGASVSNVEEDQLFYLQTRGIDALTARTSLVFSFAAEVLRRLPTDSLRKRVESDLRKLLEETLNV